MGPAEVGIHRDSAQVVALLAAADVDLPAEVAFGLGGGIGFMYAVFEYREVPHPLLTLVCQHHPQPFAPAILDRLGIRFRTGHTTSPRRARAALEWVLGEGRPAILGVGRGGLAWQHTTAMTRGEEHLVLVMPGPDGPIVVDGATEHAVDLDLVLAAWGMTRTKHLMICLDGRPTQPGDLGPAVRDALSTTVAHMTGPVLGNAFDANFGLSGLDRWAAQLATSTKASWRHRFADPVAFTAAMGRLVDGIDLQYTAPTASRPLFASFLRHPDVAMPEAAEHFEASAALWRAIADRAAQFGRALGPDRSAQIDPVAMFDWLAERVGQIRALEQRGLAEITQSLPA